MDKYIKGLMSATSISPVIWTLQRFRNIANSVTTSFRIQFVKEFYLRRLHFLKPLKELDSLDIVGHVVGRDSPLPRLLHRPGEEALRGARSSISRHACQLSRALFSTST